MVMIMDFFMLSGVLDRQTFIKRFCVVLLAHALVVYSFSWGLALLSWAALFVTTFSMLSLIMRRCRDMGLSSFLTLLVMAVCAIPLLNLFVATWLAIAKGK
ncbi:MAG TPA: hypothetical protein IAB06_03455 [Candidatus Avacidaminococcus intestinavium]|uniref:Uncharacterized protein n=1 Tax=Candidatus Avacidaminococcus intestinavium TaxID=2840684 RepID=A0A9D1MPV5_9FIRM|nr:hypothetical protein [Candidatus Avacidaminococcus intestinavium]